MNNFLFFLGALICTASFFSCGNRTQDVEKEYFSDLDTYFYHFHQKAIMAKWQVVNYDLRSIQQLTDISKNEHDKKCISGDSVRIFSQGKENIIIGKTFVLYERTNGDVFFYKRCGQSWGATKARNFETDSIEVKFLTGDYKKNDAFARVFLEKEGSLFNFEYAKGTADLSKYHTGEPDDCLKALQDISIADKGEPGVNYNIELSFPDKKYDLVYAKVHKGSVSTHQRVERGVMLYQYYRFDTAPAMWGGITHITDKENGDQALDKVELYAVRFIETGLYNLHLFPEEYVKLGQYMPELVNNPNLQLGDNYFTNLDKLLSLIPKEDAEVIRIAICAGNRPGLFNPK